MRFVPTLVVCLLVTATAAAAAPAAGVVGTSFPSAFAVPTDASLGSPVLGFGAVEGRQVVKARMT